MNCPAHLSDLLCSDDAAQVSGGGDIGEEDSFTQSAAGHMALHARIRYATTAAATKTDGALLSHASHAAHVHQAA